jgi:NCS2 family nucleobase:cation symporter-2
MVLGLGVALRPEVLQQFPAEVQTLFGSALVTSGFITLLLNIAIPGGGVGTGPTEYIDSLAPETPTNLEENLPESASAND